MNNQKQNLTPEEVLLTNYSAEIEKKLREIIPAESNNHGIDHLLRIKKIALHIQALEGGDRLIIGIAALLHDMHRLIEMRTGKYCQPDQSLGEVENILNEVNFSADKINAVLHSVEHHEEYAFGDTGKTVDDIETLILQDADNLDAMGAVGIARTFTFGGSHNVPIYQEGTPFNREGFDDGILDPSQIHHFYSKLLKLKDNMNTPTAKEMADHRHEFMEQFLTEFFKEWQGEK